MVSAFKYEAEGLIASSLESRELSYAISAVVGHSYKEIITKACGYIWQRQGSVIKEQGTAGRWPVCPGKD